MPPDHRALSALGCPLRGNRSNPSAGENGPRLDGVAHGGSASCLPTWTRPSLRGGATEMLGRVIVYAYVVLFAASLLLEQPIPLAIEP